MKVYTDAFIFFFLLSKRASKNAKDCMAYNGRGSSRKIMDKAHNQVVDNKRLNVHEIASAASISSVHYI